MRLRRWLVKLLVVATIVVVLLLIIKRKDMSVRQSILKVIYPAIMAAGKVFKSDAQVLDNSNNVKAPHSLYAIKATANDGSEITLNQFRGKKLLIVNTASDCGYTGQYEELEKLYREYSDRLTILAFPANDFKQQEKGTDEEIAGFCQKNYGVTFPLMKKSVVVKGNSQNPVFAWLSEKDKNGWNNQEPVWNFSKYLVDENGNLVAYFAPSVSPLNEALTHRLKP